MEKGNFKFSTVSSKDNKLKICFKIHFSTVSSKDNKLKISFKIHLNNTGNNSPIQ